jgi:hypothetical protein
MIVIINCPFTNYHILNINKNKLKNTLEKYDEVNFYDVKFSLLNEKKLDFNLEDLSFESVAKDINKKYNKKIFLIGIEHGSAYAQFYAQKYSKYCKGLICFPLRNYTKENLQRRIYKYKNNKGWEKLNNGYNINKYFLKINNERLQEIISKQNNNEKLILFLVVELELRKQYTKLTNKFTIPTILYIRQDFDYKSIISRNYKTKAIAEMKNIASENDAVIYSCIIQIQRVKEIDKIIYNNKDNLIVNYIPHQDNKNLDYGIYIVNSIKSLFKN